METFLFPYEIEHDGTSYFGNVRLCETYIFERDGATFLYNVYDKTARDITADQAVMIRQVENAFGKLIPQSVVSELKRLNLLLSDRGDDANGSVSNDARIEDDDAYAVTRIALFVAQDCNMGCVYCYGKGGVYDGKGMMTEEMAFRSVDWLMRSSLKVREVNIGFFGGEPLLNFGLIKKVVSYAKNQATDVRKHVNFSITTNGSLLTDEIIRFLKEEHVKILISFDGPREYQDSKRPFSNGKGSYDKVVSNIQKLKKDIPDLTGRATVCADMDPAIVKAGMEAVGLTNCTLVTASPADFDSGRSSGDDELIDRMVDFNRDEAAKLLTSIQSRSIDRGNIPNSLHVMLEIDSGEKRHYGCGMGKGMAGVSITGDVYPCHRFVGQKEFRLGNVDSYQAGVVNKYWRASVDALPECASCWARHLCGGGCSYHNKALTGDMHTPHPSFCHQTRLMFEDLIRVYCELSDDDLDYISDLLNGTMRRGCSCNSSHEERTREVVSFDSDYAGGGSDCLRLQDKAGDCEPRAGFPRSISLPVLV